MEGLAAVGAASSIVQLVDFSLKVVATAKEVRLTGSSLQNEVLEDVYQQMASVLQPVTDLTIIEVPRRADPRYRAILELAKTAHKDCVKILDLINKLKAKGGGCKQWASMVVAFRSMMGEQKILEIETRLRTELASVSIELTKITWYVDKTFTAAWLSESGD